MNVKDSSSTPAEPWKPLNVEDNKVKTTDWVSTGFLRLTQKQVRCELVDTVGKKANIDSFGSEKTQLVARTVFGEKVVYQGGESTVKIVKGKIDNSTIDQMVESEKAARAELKQLKEQLTVEHNKLRSKWRQLDQADKEQGFQDKYNELQRSFLALSKQIQKGKIEDLPTLKENLENFQGKAQTVIKLSNRVLPPEYSEEVEDTEEEDERMTYQPPVQTPYPQPQVAPMPFPQPTPMQTPAPHAVPTPSQPTPMQPVSTPHVAPITPQPQATPTRPAVPTAAKPPRKRKTTPPPTNTTPPIQPPGSTTSERLKKDTTQGA